MTAPNKQGNTEATAMTPDPTERTLQRRTFLGGVVTAGASPVIQDDGNQTGSSQDVDTHYVLGAHVNGWRGRAPARIEGAVNPTLRLQPGNTYRVTWINLNGVRHNFTIEDSDGENITSTQTMSREGERLSLTFTAARAMDQYSCTVHPNTMRGNLQIAQPGPSGDAQAEEPEPVDTEFAFGAVVEGWQGRAPKSIKGKQNPTMHLEPGNQYRVVWENVDGVEHNFAIQNAEGDEIMGTKITDKQAETLTLTFTATEEMDRYLCVIHPDVMVGDIQTGGGGEGVGGMSFTKPWPMVGRLTALTVGVVGGLTAALYAFSDESSEP